MKLKKIKISQLKEKVGKLPRILAEKAFLTFLGLLFLVLILSALLYYKYIFSVERAKPEILDKPLQLNESAFQDVSNKLQDRAKEFQEAGFKNYPDLFARPSATPPLTQ